MLIRRPFAGNVNRSLGVELPTGSARAFIAVGAIPPDLEIALDDQQGPRIPIAEGDYIRHDFSSLWLFHTAASVADAFSIIASDERDFIDRESVELQASSFVSNVTNVAGGTIVAAAAAGKRFRVLEYQVELTGNATLGAAGVLTLEVAGGPQFAYHRIYLPAAVPAAPEMAYSFPPRRLGRRGYAIPSGSNFLISLSAALTNGFATINAQVLEEPVG